MIKPVILVTGANGFVGQHFTRFLKDNDYSFYTLSRGNINHQNNAITLDNFTSVTFNTVVHLAGRAHVLKEIAADPVAEFRAANVDFTMAVAKAAVAAGVKRFVFVSSVGVYGNYSALTPITEVMPPAPKELYAVSKLEAENQLREYLSKHGVELVILRPALIYGDKAPGNLAKLFKLCDSNVPLPFRNALARRTMLNVFSFCQALLLSASKPEAAGKIYNVADSTGISTSEIVSCFKKQLGRRNIQFSLPLALLKWFMQLTKKDKMYKQLFESFTLDSHKLQTELGWQPVSNPGTLLETINLKNELNHAKS